LKDILGPDAVVERVGTILLDYKIVLSDKELRIILCAAGILLDFDPEEVGRTDDAINCIALVSAALVTIGISNGASTFDQVASLALKQALFVHDLLHPSINGE
jgi:hypothetical protein